MSAETDSTYGLHKEIILSCTLQEEDQFICNSGLLFHGCGLHFVKGLTKKLNFVILSRRKICNIFRFSVHKLWAAYCPGGRAKFQVHCLHCLHGCGLHYNVLSALSVKQEVKG